MINVQVKQHSRTLASGKTTTVSKHKREISIGEKFGLSGNRTFTVKNKPFVSGGQKFYSGHTTTSRSSVGVPTTINERKLNQKIVDNRQENVKNDFFASASEGQKTRVKRIFNNLNEKPNEYEVSELTLSIDNIEPLYNQNELVKKGLDKKKEKGTYSKQLAILSFNNVVDNANTQYKKEFGTSFGSVSKAHASKELLDNYEREYEEKYPQ